MKLSTKGLYAVMAMVDLAKFGGNTPLTLAKIAERQGVSLNYLEQLFNKLRRSGLVVSNRGPGGGYRLAAEAGAINIADIMFAVDEPVHAIRCGGDIVKGCRGKGKCLTHDLWNALGAHILSFLGSLSLADVLEGDVFEFVAPGLGCQTLARNFDVTMVPGKALGPGASAGAAQTSATLVQKVSQTVQ